MKCIECGSLRTIISGYSQTSTTKYVCECGCIFTVTGSEKKVTGYALWLNKYHNPDNKVR